MRVSPFAAAISTVVHLALSLLPTLAVASPINNFPGQRTALCDLRQASRTLKVEKAILAQKIGTDAEGIPLLKPDDDSLFKQGDTVYLILKNTGQFQRGEGGMHHLEMDVAVKDGSGKILLMKERLLGEKGRVDLENNIAPAPYGNLDTTLNTPPGKYIMVVTIYDLIGCQKAISTVPFRITATRRPKPIRGNSKNQTRTCNPDRAVEKLTVEQAVLARRTGGSKQEPVLEPIANNVFKQGETVYLILKNTGKFKRGQDGLHHLEIDVQVREEEGKILIDKKRLLGKRGQLLLEKDIAQGPYGNVDIDQDAPPGDYSIGVTIYDLVSCQKASRSARFRVIDQEPTISFLPIG
ncbi:hypothetical protein BST81_24780 [Leptolyngbya sp. 'hensonii']|uniref:hypothetical protein n=1 Tax=Leptolyngbya sp. 'hensonii' TaxID=1922337 RepID=UPI00094F9DA7|nr:hypothetical protein [Leptolyngbya sp. 'hensonii']OLP15738.1 hypothetical protein BST81_24780 [Leptolyngbya sp. 'hensonii']